MRLFSCGRCGASAAFEADRCHRCGIGLGYLPASQDLRPVHETSDGFAASEGTDVWWRCLNHAWGCNWLVPRGEAADVWCASCRLTGSRPDLEHPPAVEAWSEAERAKRRLIHQLLTLGLPLAPRTNREPALVFHLLDLRDGAGGTGHYDGAVTLDLRELEMGHRETVRRELREPFRTVMGHLRHEVGHHYWTILVAAAGALDEFRALFGDERANYQEALAAYYARRSTGASAGFITSYAMAHPAEDWADTFAHTLHLLDGLETAAAHGFAAQAAHGDDLAGRVAAWQRVVDTVDAINIGLGHPPAYATQIASHRDASGAAWPDQQVLEKLAFVDRQIRGGDSRRAAAHRT